MKILGLLGYPVSHSISPTIFNACFKKFGLPYIYQPFEVPPPKLTAAINGLKVLGISGVNVTIPHKTSVVKKIEELDEIAIATGSVNTILFDKGRSKGYNTDAVGFLRAWQEDIREKLEGKVVAMIGAGGAARSVAYALLGKKIKEIHIFVRKTPSADGLIDTLSPGFPRIPITVHRIEDSKAWLTLGPKIDIIINATPVGMTDINESPVSLPVNLRPGFIAYDLIYNPLMTKFLKQAEARKGKAYGGLGMLIHQAALSYEIWVGESAPISLMKWAAWEVLKGK